VARIQTATGRLGCVNQRLCDILGHSELKCLFMSGYTANVIAHHGVLDEGVEFQPKPFTNQTLAERVREVLDTARDQPRSPQPT
jgi:hypothetical protein